MLIYSITVNAYGIDKNNRYSILFPNVYITCNANSLPSNSLVANCDASYTRDVVRVLDNVGCDFCGWEETIEYGINTYLIPKMLESRINGVTQPIIRLSSSDKQHIGIYEFGFLIADIYQPYEGIVDGNLVCANLDGSAAYIPFMAGFRFNVQ